MRKRVVPGVYTGAAAHEATGGTAYCVAVNGGDASNESDEYPFDVSSDVDPGAFTVMLGASNTVSIGITHAVLPTFESGQVDCN